MTTVVGWDDARTARAYERFCRRHMRYRAANDALVAHAALESGHRVLDVAAGTGRTAEAVLPHVGPSGRVLCVEPARGMREAGANRLPDARVEWTDALPDCGTFDRIVCGAGIWQLLPIETTLARLSALLAPAGALAFNIPAAYVLEPDRPGGGRDPLLLELIAFAERSDVPTNSDAPVASSPWPAHEIDDVLEGAGLRIERWSFELRLTQAAYRDWLKIPPVSEGLFAGVSPDERARRLDSAYRKADHRSWKWERWIGWTAWRA